MFSSAILTPKVNEFVNRYTRSLGGFQASQFTDKLINWRDMMRRDPISRFCVEIIFLYMFSMLKDYQHSKATIRKDIRRSIESLDTDWIDTLRLMASSKWYGFSWSEVAVQDTLINRKLLKDIRTLDPCSYHFETDKGEIQKVIYKGDTDLELDYNTGIHIVEGVDYSFDYLYGCGLCETVYPYWELHQLMMPVLAIAGQRQATPILVKKCDTSADVLLINPATGQPYIDEFGNDVLVKKGWDAVQQLQQLGSAGITAIDPADELFSIELKCDGEFLLNVIKTCEQSRMIGFLVPGTVGSFSLSGLGDSGLAQYHMELFKQLTKSSIEALMNKLIKKLFKPLIIFNHGEQSNYGWFDIDDKNPNALEISKVALSAISTGKIGLDHLDTINLVRNNLGLGDFNPEDPEDQTY